MEPISLIIAALGAGAIAQSTILLLLQIPHLHTIVRSQPDNHTLFPSLQPLIPNPSFPN
ncbi:hypothetical protein [Nostoc piscinale]|uniref:hypothetical protein n=1 Tax=Nostoc piscinale TaxID=224012 RepID=UPI00130E5DB1|nr:hypothetical protein [Nostoc piscinale]